MPQHVARAVAKRFGKRQLPAPRYALFAPGTGAVVFIFRKKRRFVPLGPLPVRPTGGKDVAAQFTTPEYHLGVVAPRAAQKDSIYPFLGGQSATAEHKAEFYGRRRAGRCDVRVAFAVYFATVKDYRGRAKNEIGGTI